MEWDRNLAAVENEIYEAELRARAAGRPTAEINGISPSYVDRAATEGAGQGNTTDEEY